MKHGTGFRVTHECAVFIQNFSQAADSWYGSAAGACFRGADHGSPNRTFNCQFVARLIVPLKSAKFPLTQSREGSSRNQTLRQQWKTLKDLDYLVEIIGVRLSRFSRIVRDRRPFDGVCAIKRSLVLGIRKDSAQHRLDAPQCASRKTVLFGDCSQRSASVHGAKFSQANFSHAIVEMLPPDAVIACACTGSTLLFFGPRQVDSFSELSNQRN